MKGQFFNCGCSITECMFTNKLLDVHFCSTHIYEYSDENKTLRELAVICANIPREAPKKCCGGNCGCHE